MDIAATVHSLVNVVGVGLVLGAGLPALFALGLRLAATPEAVDGGPPRASRGGRTLGALCFAVVALAVVVGVVWIIVGDGH